MNERQHIQVASNPNTWSQWGKAAFAFTVVTGAYAISKAVGMVWSNQNVTAQDQSMVVNKEQIVNLNPVLLLENINDTDKNFFELSNVQTIVDIDNTIGKTYQQIEDFVLSSSPLISISTVALTATHKSFLSLSTFTLSLMYQMSFTEAVFPAVLELANITQSEGSVLRSIVYRGDKTGNAVSDAGDINGDGIDDILVGAYQADLLGRGNAGAVYILFGRNNSWPATIDLANLNPNDGVILQGAAANDETGISVSRCEDVNGDGIEEILVGTHFANPNGRSNAGVVYVIFGRNSSWPASIDLDNLNATDGVIIEGAVATDETGFSVSSAGDINGDGISDMLIGAIDATPLSRDDSGVVYILFGRNGNWPATIDLSSFNSNDGVVLQGEYVQGELGASVSSAGDINNDGIADLLVGAHLEDPFGRIDSGNVYILYGRNNTWPAAIDLANFNINDGVVIHGATSGDRTGYSVAAVGDINGDSLDDVMIGAYLADPLGRSNAGVVYVIFGHNGSWPVAIDLANLNATDGIILQGAVATDETGISVSGVGDINGDGISDMLVGASEASSLSRDDPGVVYVLFGRSGNWPAIIDLLSFSSNDGVILQGIYAHGDLGVSVSSAGDVNNDGLVDLLVGAWHADPSNLTDAGAVYILFGRNGTWPAIIDLAMLNSTDGVFLQGASFGETALSVSQTGDINGDGINDILVGANFADPYGRGNAGVTYILYGRNGNWPMLIDLNNLNLAEGILVQGAAANDELGFSVSQIGDINGDGIPDILIGARDVDVLSRTDAGAVYILFGRNNSWPAAIDLANFNVIEGVIIQGGAVRDFTGRSVSCGGDVNDDGIGDIIIGASDADPKNRIGAGIAYVIFGRNGSWPVSIDLNNLNASTGVIFQGAATGDNTGYSVSGIGDVNGDGIDDLLIGAEEASPLSRTDAGIVYLVFGRSVTWPGSIDFANLTVGDGVQLQGATASDNLGYSVSYADDINGDGINDMLIAAPQADPFGRRYAGVVYILFGRNSSWPPTIDLATFNSSQGCILQGAAANDQLGYSVSSAGDVNGDGRNDIIIGAWADSNQLDPGTAYVIFGRNGSWPASIDLATLNSSQGLVLQGAVMGDRTGYSVDGAGDINNDGLDDLLVGTYFKDPIGRRQSGAVYIIYGQREESLNTQSQQLTSVNTLSLNSAQTNEALSSAANSDIFSQNTLTFQVVSNTILYAEIDIQVIITTENLSVEGFTGDPRQLIFTVSNTPGVTFFVNDVQTNQFTLFDLQSGYVDLLVDTAACENDLSSVEIEASDGVSTVPSPLNLNVDYGSCIYNMASTLNAKSSLQGAALLLVSSGFGMFASKRREKTKLEKTESNVIKTQNDNHLEMKLSA